MSSASGYEELGPGRFAIAARTGDRLLFTYLFHDEGEALLLDCGEASTAEEAILPALEALGVGPEQLRRILVTHPDVDHQGGLARMLEFAPEAEVLCGFEDRPMIADPEAMLQQRYRAYLEHGLDYGAEQLAGIRAAYGAPAPIAGTLLGGERLRAGAIELRVHHGPGHAAGHMMLEDPGLGALFISDAVHGRYSPSLDGGRALPVTYEDVDAYLRTIERVRAIAPRVLYSGHFEPLRGPEVGEFLEQSADFVEDLDRYLLRVLAGGGSSLEQLCSGAAAEFGPFSAPDFFFMFAVHGHLRRLARDGRVEQAPTRGPSRPSYQLVEG